MFQRHLFAFFCFPLLVLALFAASPVFGATLTVTSTADDGSAGTLRYAIANAAAGDTINFSPTDITYPATITLSLPACSISCTNWLTIATNLTITGPGASSLTISGGANNNVLVVNGGVTAAISGLTITNLDSDDCGNYYSGNCAGILNNGTLTLTDCTVSGNNIDVYIGGGGITNTGTLTVTNSTFSNNYSRYLGGGIWNDGGTLTVTNSTFSGNSSNAGGFWGGAIYNGGLTFTPCCTFQNNTGTMTVTNSTFTGNTSGVGGAIVNWGPGTVINSTFSGNSAGGRGGAIDVEGPLSVTNSTFSGNSAPLGGGDIVVSIFSVTTATLKNTLLANSPSGGNCSIPFGGVIASDGHNLSDDGSCSGSFTGTGDQNSVSLAPYLGPLGNNGGPTQTMALLPVTGNPAIDAIPVSPTNYCTLTDGVTPVATDQRGITRPQGPACDIGAFEVAATPKMLVTELLSYVTVNKIGPGKSLPSQLTQIATDINVGAISLACADLNTFAGEVKAQTGKKITASESSFLLATVAVMESSAPGQLNCGG